MSNDGIMGNDGDREDAAVRAAHRADPSEVGAFMRLLRACQDNALIGTGEAVTGLYIQRRLLAHLAEAYATDALAPGIVTSDLTHARHTADAEAKSFYASVVRFPDNKDRRVVIASARAVSLPNALALLAQDWCDRGSKMFHPSDDREAIVDAVDAMRDDLRVVLEM